MADPPTVARPPVYWVRFVDTVTLAWLGVFLLVVLHLDYPVWDFLEPSTIQTLDTVLFGMTVLFIVDLGVQYRCSHLTATQFLRTRWFDVLMAIPFFRPLRGLRILRVGRLARVFRVVTQAKKAFSLFRKSKRTFFAWVRRQGKAEPNPVQAENE